MHRVIQTRSPFFIQKSTAQAIVNLELKIWTGDVTAVPTEVTYLLTKVSTDSQATFEISELVRDYLSHTSTTKSGYAWLRSRVYDSDGEVVETYLAAEGYKIYTEGLQSNGQNLFTDTQFIALPEENANEYRIAVTENANNLIPVHYWQNTSYTRHLTSGQIEASVPLTPPTTSNNALANVSVNKTTDKIVFDIDGVTKTVFVDVLECSKYETLELMYVNKDGAKVFFPFNLKHQEQLSTSEDGFNRSLVNYGNLSLGNQLHANRRRITGSKQSFELNSNWISEYYVKQLEELILSEYVWLFRTGQNAIPVNIKEDSFIKKTHINDKLINYTIKVQTASEYINIVR